MADMLADLLNQAGGQNWWNGDNPVSPGGRGAYMPRDTTPPEAAAVPADPAAPATQAAGPAQPAAGASPPKEKQLTQSQMIAQTNIDRLKQKMLEYQKQIIQYQGTEYGAKIQKYLMQAQLDLQKNQAILAGTW